MNEKVLCEHIERLESASYTYQVVSGGSRQRAVESDLKKTGNNLKQKHEDLKKSISELEREIETYVKNSSSSSSSSRK